MKLLVFLVLSIACLDSVRAKSEPATVQDPKLKISTKHNALSTTPKPDTQYQTIQQHQLQQYEQNYQQQQSYQPQQQSYQPQQQSYQPQQQYPQQPLQPQLQRPLIAQPQRILFQHQPQVQQIQYQPQLQVQAPQQLAHLVQNAFYVPQKQQQPAAMIIIAQPTYVPSNIVQGGATQPLLNLFHGNPQARYQFLHGNYQQQPVQQVVQPTPAHSIGTYQVVAVPAQYQPNIVAVPVQHSPIQATPVPTTATAQQPNPLQLAQIAQIANQQYARISPSPQPETAYPQQYQQEARALQSIQSQIALPLHSSIPPIITGLENFSPEQQEKIKAQLSAHFGAPLRPLSSGRTAQNPAHDKGVNQYSGKYQAVQLGLNGNEFIPSEQVKEGSSASSSNVSKPNA